MQNKREEENDKVEQIRKENQVNVLQRYRLPSNKLILKH